MAQAETRVALLIDLRSTAKADVLAYTVIATVGVLLWWLCRAHASILPLWAPWDFSWAEFLSGWLAIWWFGRGISLMSGEERPGIARQISFFAGVLLIYAVLETHFGYLAEHQFFFNRIQHVVMHHLGPLLIALAWPGAAITRAMPAPLTRVIQHPIPVGVVHALQQPVFAAILFVGSFFFWLIPSIHFRAMIDSNLFAFMNWTMVADGILFWCLVLDPRPSPPARVSFGGRAALAMVVMFPQILGGAMIAFNPHDLYSFYDLCGRIYPDMGALYDQTVGGLIVWIPPAMMSVLALLLVLNAMRRSEERTLNDEPEDPNDFRPIIRSSQWTG